MPADDLAPRGTTVAVYAPSLTAMATARRHFPLRSVVIPTCSWSLFTSVVSGCDCAVVYSPAPLPARRAALARLRMAAPFVPIVEIAPTNQSAAVLPRLHLVGTPRDCESAGGLWALVQAACTLALLERFARMIEDSHAVSDALKDAITALCERTPAIRTLAELAAVTGHNRRTLWQHWRRCGPSATLRLEDVADWMLALRAGVLHAERLTWTDAARRLGIDRHTVARIVRRHVGKPLAAVDAEDQARLREGFLRTVIEPLIEARQPGV